MKSEEIKPLLIDAEQEIRSLRSRNELLSAKVDVLDLFACVLFTKPFEPGQSMAIDVAWRLRKKIDELTEQESEPQHAKEE